MAQDAHKQNVNIPKDLPKSPINVGNIFNKKKSKNELLNDESNYNSEHNVNVQHLDNP